MRRVSRERAATRRRRLHGDHGVSAMLVALSLVPLLVIAALVVDLGNARQQTRLAQTSADAAALAGAADLPIPSDTAATKAAAPAAVKADSSHFAAINTVGDAATATTVTCPASVPANATCYTSGKFSFVVATPYTGSSSGIDPASLVYVQICQPTATFFGSVVRWRSPNVCRDAVARRLNASGGYDYGLVALDPSKCGALTFAGNSDTVLSSNGAVMVDSNCESTTTGALDASGSTWQLISNFIGVVGSATLAPCDPTVSTKCTQTVPTKIPTFPDPLGNLTEPSQPANTESCGGGSTGSTQTLDPGYYPSLCKITKGDVALHPGIYYFDGGFDMNGGSLTCVDSSTATCAGTGVLLFIHQGALTLNGNGATNLPPYKLSPYDSAGLSIWQSKGDTNEATVNGTADGVNLGTIYIPSANLKANGTGYLTITGMVIAKTVYISGTFNFTINVPNQAPDITPLDDIGLVQ